MSDASGDAIMDRLLVLVGEIKEFKFTARNEVEIGEGAALPGCVILEGDEESPVRPGETPHRRPPATPSVMHMFPLVCMAAEAPAKDIGNDLRALRRKVMKAVLHDATLLALTGANGAIHYRGFVTNFVVGEKIIGKMALRFEFKYLLAPATF